MPTTIRGRLQHAWNAFKDPAAAQRRDWKNYGATYGQRPDRNRLRFGVDRSIIAAIYNRIAIDVAGIDIKHIRTDQNGRYLSDIKGNLNDRLTLSPNIDQTARAFFQDVAMSLFDEGSIAIVPVETDINPITQGGYEILQMRVGKIVEWMPLHVRVDCYNQITGQRIETVLPKSVVAIVENPLYAVMNDQNSTLKRLIRALNQLDAVGEQSSSGKLDILVQLPYTIKSEARRQQAETRRKDIEMQLTGSKYGIAYIDATERITQLNRPAENNLMTQVEYLTSMLYSQLGLTESVFDGTADERTMLNYHNRTIEPIVSAIVDSMKRTFLTKTARTQGQSIIGLRDPFKLVPVDDIATIADKFTRNEILSSNEVRAIVGYRPADDPRADELRNKNLNQSKDAESGALEPVIVSDEGGE